MTIVTVALPDMALDLRTSFSALEWVVDIYALILAALLLAMGSLGDLYGRRRLYLGGLALFALASLGSGLAHSTAELIAARGVQGVGGAAMYATTIALLNSAYQGRDRGVAFGIWGAVSGAAAGPVLGGLLTQGLSWRWIFFVNLPVSIAALVVTRRAFSADRPERRTRLDVPGLVTFTVGATAVTFALIRVSAVGWAAGQTLGLLAAGLAAWAGFAVIEHRSAAPLLDLALLRRPAFAGVLVAGLIAAGIGVGLATPTLVSNAMSAVPQRSGGMAAGAVNTARQLGFTIGVALLGSIFAARTATVLAARGTRSGMAPAVTGGQARAVLAHVPAAQQAGLDQAIHAAAAAGLNLAFLVAGLLGLAGAVIAAATMRRPAHPAETGPAVPAGSRRLAHAGSPAAQAIRSGPSVPRWPAAYRSRSRRSGVTPVGQCARERR
jgi:MFS family permease